MARRAAPAVLEVEQDGLATAQPAPAVLPALAGADLVILAPSSPVASLAPILGLPGVRAAVAAARAVAVTPVVSGVAPATPPEQSRARVREAFLAAAGLPHTATAVAGLYADIVDWFVLDERDAGEADAIRGLGVDVVLADTLATGAGRVALAEARARLSSEESPTERREAFEMLDASSASARCSCDECRCRRPGNRRGPPCSGRRGACPGGPRRGRRAAPGWPAGRRGPPAPLRCRPPASGATAPTARQPTIKKRSTPRFSPARIGPHGRDESRQVAVGRPAVQDPLGGHRTVRRRAREGQRCACQARTSGAGRGPGRGSPPRPGADPGGRSGHREAGERRAGRRSPRRPQPAAARRRSGTSTSPAIPGAGRPTKKDRRAMDRLRKPE